MLSHSSEFLHFRCNIKKNNWIFVSVSPFLIHIIRSSIELSQHKSEWGKDNKNQIQRLWILVPNLTAVNFSHSLPFICVIEKLFYEVSSSCTTYTKYMYSVNSYNKVHIIGTTVHGKLSSFKKISHIFGSLYRTASVQNW